MTSYNIVNPTNLVQGMPENIADVVANFQAIQGVVNGNLDDGNIKAAAAISISKLASYPADATRYLRGDGTWAVISVSALPADTVVAAATRIVSNITTAGDTQPAWRVLGSGRMDWGPGGATAPDTNLYRNAASSLKTDGQLQTGLGIYSSAGLANQINLNTDGKLYFSSAFDTNLYRSAAGILKTDNSFITAGNLSVLLATGDTQPQIVLSRNFAGSGLPGIQFGVGGSTAGDTNLYRNAVGVLKSDGRIDSLIPQASATKSADQSIANGTWTLISWDTETFDTDTIHDTVTNNDRLTCKTAGLYMIGFNANWFANTTGIRAVQIQKNTEALPGVGIAGKSDSAPSTGITAPYNAVGFVQLAVNDYICVTVYQNSGGALNFNAAGASFWMTRIGP